MENSTGWICFYCNTINPSNVPFCNHCGSARVYLRERYGFFQPTFVSHQPPTYTSGQQKKRTKIYALTRNLTQDKNDNTATEQSEATPKQTANIFGKTIKLLELYIVRSKKDKDNPYKDSIKDILKKLKSQLGTELGEDDKEILTQNKYTELLEQLIAAETNINYSDLTNLQKKLYITADVIDSPLIKKLFDLLTGAEILSALGISPPQDPAKKEDKKEEKQKDKKEGEKEGEKETKKEGEKKEEKKYTSEELIKKIRKDWKKGNLDDIKQNLELDVLKEYETTTLKESITQLINSKNSIMRTIEKIKQQKLNKQLSINQEPQTDDDILKELEDDNEGDDDDDD